uniref:Mitochondrial import inner membrane translocase subunit n=1 Tax=Rhabditophanes sp. KR3021 TaxID=114890 RepID=A0AC35TRM7_9BILA
MNTDPALSGFLHELQAETQKAKFAEQVHTLAGRCWDMCFPDNRYSSKMEAKNERCLNNCVNRMLDASVFMVNHFQSGQGGSQQSSTQQPIDAKKSGWW